MGDAKNNPPGGAPRREWGILAEDVLIWAAVLALWPRILQGHWIFTGAWVTVLLWAALTAMLAVAVRRVWRVWKGPAGGASAGRSAKGSHAQQ
jgi:hypothetical protein